ncbi:MAG: c-type cytochrome [Rhizobiales bacterium]|nr:c-type cytochrome [Hyphomicrobiales bacterium]
MMRLQLDRLATALAILVALGQASALAGEAVGQLKPDPVRGYEVAQRACAVCHALGDEDTRPLPSGVPTFPAIANKPGQTVEGIMASIVLPHPPMLDTHLTKAEIMDVISYLDSLRPGDAEPLLEPGEDKKPLNAPQPS